MDTNQRNNPLLTWAYYCQGKSMEDLRQSLLYTTLDLEQTRAAVQDELRKRDEQLLNLKELLNNVIRERDDAQEKCQRLLLEKFVLQQQQQQNGPVSGISSIEDEPRNNNGGISSSDCEESIVSSPQMPPPPQQQPQPPPLTESTIELTVTPDRPLPEKGKLLQAVMKAGPLLQTLLLAGPLPQWRHPPPPLESFEIPPVTIPSVLAPPPPPPEPAAPPQAQFLHQDSFCGRVSSRKRVFCDQGNDSSPSETKYQRLVLQ